MIRVFGVKDDDDTIPVGGYRVVGGEWAPETDAPGVSASYSFGDGRLTVSLDSYRPSGSTIMGPDDIEFLDSVVTVAAIHLASQWDEDSGSGGFTIEGGFGTPSRTHPPGGRV